MNKLLSVLFVALLMVSCAGQQISPPPEITLGPSIPLKVGVILSATPTTDYYGVDVVKELNEPRLPSLKGKMAAKKAVILKWGASDIMADQNDLGLKGSPTQVKNIFTPEARSGRKILEGDTEEQVNALIQEMRGIKCL